jgi:hypothetical protein
LREAQHHTSSSLLCICACFSYRARLTDLFRKENLDYGFSLRVLVQIPGTALLPLRTVIRWCCQSMWKCSRIQCSRSMSLLTGIDMDWPHHIDPMGFSTVQDPFGTDKARIDERHVREVILSSLHPLGWEQGHVDLVQSLARFRLV